MIRTHKISEVSAAIIGASVTLGGWVNSIRRLGKLSFVELRDSSGLIQLSFISGVAKPELMQLAEKLGPEAVMSATGIVRARPRKRSGESEELVEIEVTAAEVFNQPESLPFPVTNDTPVPAKLKLEHRTLYLRRERLHRNMVLRSRIFQFVRNWLVERGFHEIDTPVLFKTTVGGAREFIVPTRSHPGEFYVLRQSPQQLKQMLMASGFDKYFQICKLFHDTHTRSQRQREFTALDLEVAFATEPDIIELVQDLMAELAVAANSDFVVSKPFPRIKHFECLERFGAEDADLRFAIEAGKLNDESYLVRIPYRLVPLYEQDLLQQFAKEGVTIAGQSLVGSTDTIPEQVNIDWRTKLTETRNGDLVLFLKGQGKTISEAVETSRVWINDHLDPLPWKNELTFLWTECQPLFKQDSASGEWKVRHQAFTAPVDPGQLERADPDLPGALGREYVLSCNGAGLGGGSARIISPELQRRVFQLDGMSESEIDFFFGPLLRALASGAPPHAGATLSLDALIRLLAGEEHLSEIIAFPKLGTGIDPLTGAPNTLPDELLKEFGLARLT
jgi:aspartyl-tRNA synthetase